MLNNSLHRRKRRRIGPWVIVILALAVLGPAAWFLFIRFEGQPPDVHTAGIPAAIGKTADVVVDIADPDSGLRSVRMELVSKGKSHVLIDKHFPSAGFFYGGATFDKQIALTVDPRQLGIADGEAELRLTVKDYAWRNWWGGNEYVFVKALRIDLAPPAVEMISKAHNINQGGAGLVVYRLSEPCPNHGVQVGDTFFPGASGHGPAGDICLAFIGLQHDQGRDTALSVIAEDSAGNRTRTAFPYHIRGRRFKTDLINLNDRLLKRLVTALDADADTDNPDELLKRFLAINSDMRRSNYQTISALSDKSEDQVMWQKQFLRLPNAARRASFADHREYQYHGKIVDRQTHLGVDLASLTNAAVPAANSGQVIFAGPIGIYGNTVVIDHGCGLLTTYSHLSRFNVAEGDHIERGATIGYTGKTGMAVGDHLHFGVIVHRVFVNPVEWWDGSWIENNIDVKLRDAGMQR